MCKDSQTLRNLYLLYGFPHPTVSLFPIEREQSQSPSHSTGIKTENSQFTEFSLETEFQTTFGTFH